MTRRFLLCILLTSACGAEAEDPIEPLPGQVVIGGADADGTGFVALADGAEARLIPGSQGGFHIWLNVDIAGLQGRTYIERDARRMIDGELVLRTTRQVINVPEDAMQNFWHKPDAFPSFMCPSPIGLKVFDEDIEFGVHLTNEAGDLVAEDHLVLVPRCPSDDEEFCHEICSG